jgi:twitching motility protein PilT
MMDVNYYFRRMVEENASDLFIKTGSLPSARIDGKIRFLEDKPSTREFCRLLFESVVEETMWDDFQRDKEADTSYISPGIGRFRVNVLIQQGELGFVFRHINSRIPAFEELHLPREPMEKLALLHRGMVLVTGIAGSGKSTTLASLIDYSNRMTNRHIVTIEDPIEFIHHEKKCIIAQREVGIDTHSFAKALKHALRQSPDVILVGEMRDKDTIEAAIQAAETGHVLYSTLHTINATQTVERIISYFPPHQHHLLRTQLSLVIAGVVSLRLIKRKNSLGRVPAVEILMASPTMREVLYEGRTNELVKCMEEGEYYGSQTFNQSLLLLFQSDLISLEDALGASDKPDELKMSIRGINRGSKATDFDFTF